MQPCKAPSGEGNDHRAAEGESQKLLDLRDEKKSQKGKKNPKNTEKHGTAWKVQGCTARDGLRKPRVTDSNPYFLSSPYYWMAMMMAIMISTKRKLLPILEDLF